MTSPLADLLPRDAHALLDLAVKSSGPFLLYTAFVFVTGLLVGSAGAPICHHAHTASCDSYGRWAAFNTLDFETHDYPGWKSNALFWLERSVFTLAAEKNAEAKRLTCASFCKMGMERCGSESESSNLINT